MKPAPEPGPNRFQGTFSSEPEARLAHNSARGPFRLEPQHVAIPADPNDLVHLVEWSRAQGRTLVPRAAATGMPGGNVGEDVVVHLGDAFDWMNEVDVGSRSIRVGAAAVAADVEAAARAAGLRFPPLPSSARWATVGGMLASNAAGPRSFRFGSVAAYVESMEVVLPSGDVVELGPDPTTGVRIRTAAAALEGWPEVRKNSSGYALDTYQESGALRDLFVGSEGTLGFITAATLRLIEAAETSALTAVGCADLADVAAWCEWARAHGASTCELLGQRLLELMGLAADPELGSLARHAEALVLIEFEGAESRVQEGVRALEHQASLRRATFKVATSGRAATELWDLRHRASPLIQEAAKLGLRSLQFIEDSVVPPHALPAYLTGIDEILKSEETDGVVFGHAGDAHIHVNPLIDLRRPDWLTRVDRILRRTVALVVDLGGTLAGEHGDGRVRAPFLERIWGSDRIDQFRRVKTQLDPAGMLNPGVILPREGQDPLAGLSHLDL